MCHFCPPQIPYGLDLDRARAYATKEIGDCPPVITLSARLTVDLMPAAMKFRPFSTYLLDFITGSIEGVSLLLYRTYWYIYFIQNQLMRFFF
jgi:hypothetical protein